MYPLICGHVAKNRPDVLIKCTLRHVRSYRIVGNQSKKCIPSSSMIYPCNSIQAGKLIHSSAFLLIDDPSSKIEEMVPLKVYTKALEDIADLKCELKKCRYLKNLNLIRVVIDRWETNHGVFNCKIDWRTVNKLSDKIDKSKEIRRQRWTHIMTAEVTHPEVKYLLTRLSIHGISVPEFAEEIADGYDLISDRIKSVIHGIGDGLLTEKINVNRSLNILIENIEFRVGQKIR